MMFWFFKTLRNSTCQTWCPISLDTVYLRWDNPRNCVVMLHASRWLTQPLRTSFNYSLQHWFFSCFSSWHLKSSHIPAATEVEYSFYHGRGSLLPRCTMLSCASDPFGNKLRPHCMYNASYCNWNHCLHGIKTIFIEGYFKCLCAITHALYQECHLP